MENSVRLSQCMIVKDEEMYIKRALGWGKEYVCEQIVVDTGSTDRTVEIAKEMGAKVFHYNWEGDFSAAKNFAIEQASGNWVAFLDADEYFVEEGIKKLMAILNHLETVEKPDTLLCSLVNLREDQSIQSVATQIRVFQNREDIRYVNKIHEWLMGTSGNALSTGDIRKECTIYHTGYDEIIYSQKKKADRNIRLLRNSLKEQPDSYEVMAYLGEALYGNKEFEEAIQLFETVIEYEGNELTEARRNTSYGLLLGYYVARNVKEEAKKIYDIYNHCQERGHLYPDMFYLMGVWSSVNKKWEDSVVYFEVALEELNDYQGYDNLYILGNLERVYYLLATAYQELGNTPSAVKYNVMALQKNLFSENTLLGLLTMLKEDKNTTFTDLKTFLGKLYNLEQIKQKLFLYKCAKWLSYTDLVEYLYDSFSKEELLWLNENQKENKRKKYKELYPQILYRNYLDELFLDLMEEIRIKSQDEVAKRICEEFQNQEKVFLGAYVGLIDYLKKYQFWGELNPEKGIFDSLIHRAEILKGQQSDLITLYSQLEDYQSKKVLTAIVSNWLHFDYQLLGQVNIERVQYFDLNLIPSGENEVFVDVGAYTGDSARQFIEMYGVDYKRIYCYEATESTTKIMKRNLGKYENIVIKNKAVSDKTGMLRLDAKSDFSSNRTCEFGEFVEVEAVSLDEDITEEVHFIKMDIEGGEYDALLGCKKHIRATHPKLAICVYHGYDDLLRIPKLIHEIDPTYKFYLRYYGGDLLPTEVVLIAL